MITATDRMFTAYVDKPGMINFPGTLSTTVYFKGCNMKCGFCHNPELTGSPSTAPAEGALNTPLELVGRLKEDIEERWIDGIVLTGGEVLNIPEIVSIYIYLIKYIDRRWKIDTNGQRPAVLLNMLEHLTCKDYVALDLKTSKTGYSSLTGVLGWDKVQACLNLLRSSPVPYEVRSTLIPGIHTDAVFMDMCSGLDPQDRYILQPFLKSGTMLDPSFEKYDEATLEWLQERADIAKKQFGLNVTVR